MSISFEFAREPSGWVFRTDSQTDLTNWNIDYGSNRIRCTPTPMDLMYMAFGAFMLFAVAIFMLIAVVNPRWMFSAKTDTPLTSAHDPLRATKKEEMREATNQALENLLKDRSPEEKAKFLKKIEEKIESRQREAAARRNKVDVFHWLVIVVRILTILPISFLSFFGSLCLVRVLRYFRDYVDLSVYQGSLVLQRPKLLGGVSKRVLPLSEISTISCYAIQRKRRYRNVQWYVAIDSTNSLRKGLQFVVEHIPGRASLDRPTERVRIFAEAIHEMTHAPVIYPGS